MKKYLINGVRKQLEVYNTTTFTAEEDITWYRLDCLLKEQEEAMIKEARDIVSKARSEGVIFLESGEPDIEKSNKDALQRSNERIAVINNEDIDAKVLPITILNKLKCENDIPSGKYNSLLHMFLKEN